MDKTKNEMHCQLLIDFERIEVFDSVVFVIDKKIRTGTIRQEDHASCCINSPAFWSHHAKSDKTKKTNRFR